MGIYYADKVTNVYAPKVTSSSSRYKTKLRVSFSEDTKIRFIRKADLTFEDDNSAVHVVQQTEAFRPDIIAYEHFGDTKYAWIILAANNLRTAYDVVPGLQLVIPSLVSLQGNKGKLVTR